MAKAMNGVISVESKGQNRGGSCFTLEIRTKEHFDENSDSNSIRSNKN
jgi:hypothetical protein